MKKVFTQTIIVCVALTLAMTGFTFAQDVVSEEALREEALAVRKEADAVRKEASIAADMARKQASIAADMARKKAELAQKQAELASRISIPGWQYSRSGVVLVIPTAQMKIENLAAITEDMNVMSRIFARKLSQARLTTGRGNWYVEDYNPFFGRDSGTIEAVYLEGYAALFLMKVNFPLSPLPEEKEEKETEEDTDPLWTQMRQEMYAPQDTRRRRTDDRLEEKYDVEKVEELKETLIKTLKHAANIRALKPDQSVILTVIGGRSQSGTTTTTRSYGRSSMSSSISRGSSMVRRRPRVRVPTVAASLLPTVLTICAKKSDIDAFAKGELSFDQFRERTKIFASYAKVGQGGFPGVENRPVAQVQSPVL